jgi:uncharacterized protein YbbC (DUF1343 family)
VFFEATNLNEGRGTDAPLKQVGAPWLTDAAEIARVLNARNIPGIRFAARMAAVKEGDKHGGKTIPMVRLFVSNRDSAQPVAAATWLMREIRRRHPAQFSWQRGTGAERLSGTPAFRAAIDSGTVESLLARWRRESAAFEATTRPYRLYP